MATVTPNFNWPVPTSTDLVKDGATAIEALGDSIDASLVDLKGGTSGQVLSKNSNTDMDFVWVTSDDANAIQNTIVDAKGDLITATAADTPARLAVGSNGETLVADSSTSTGLRYTAGTVQGNPVLNSAFQIWQRSTSAAMGGVGGYTSADRWATYSNGVATVSRQLTGDTTNLPNIQYCARMQRTAGDTGTTLSIGNSFETINSIPYAGKTVTLSFYARCGANYSPTSSQLQAFLRTGTGTDQNLVSTGYTGAGGFSTLATLTTTWQRFSVTGTIATTATEIGIELRSTCTGTAGAADYAEFTGIQIDIGSVALPFRTYAATIQGELSACQRYYYRLNPTDGTFLGIGNSFSTTSSLILIPYPVTMRIRPTALEQTGTASNYKTLRTNGTAFDNATAVPTYDGSTNSSMGAVATTTANLTIGQVALFFSNSSTAYLGWSAEL